MLPPTVRVLPYWSPGWYRHNHSFARNGAFQPMIGFVGGDCDVPDRVMQRSPPSSTKQSTPPLETAQALMTRVPRHSTVETPRRGCNLRPGPTRALAAIRRPPLTARPRGLTLSTKVQCFRSPLPVNTRLALADVAHQPQIATVFGITSYRWCSDQSRAAGGGQQRCDPYRAAGHQDLVDGLVSVVEPGVVDHPGEPPGGSWGADGCAGSRGGLRRWRGWSIQGVPARDCCWWVTGWAGCGRRC